MVAAVADIALLVLAIAATLALLRLALGPTLADRVVALDLLTTILVAAAAVYALRHGVAVLLDVAIVVALVSFIATVAFAHHLGRRAVP